MSWATYETEIKNVINALNYTQIAQDKNLEDSAKTEGHKFYSIKPYGVANINVMSGGAFGYNNKVRVEVRYKTMKDQTLAENHVLLVQLAGAIGALEHFAGFVSDPELEEISSREYKGKIEFLFGHEYQQGA